MALANVWIEAGCISCGLCENTCPQVFAMPELAEVRPEVDYGAFEELIKEAAASCPAEVIKYE
ncbi:MAG TPA: ferredoxin [Acidobacteriota bacterium]